MKKYYIRVKTKEQLAAAAEWNKAYAYLADHTLMGQNITFPEGASVYYCMSDAARENKIGIMEKMIRNCPKGSGLLIKNLDELAMIKALGFDGPVIGDSFLYAYNSEAVRFYREILPEMKFILSDELTDHEAEKTVEKSGRDRFIYKIYGYQPLMITNQCISRNYSGCADRKMSIKDEKGNVFFAGTDCRSCTGIIYNGKCTYMIDKTEENGYSNLLVDMTVEDEEETRAVLAEIDNMDKAKKRGASANGISRGHHFKGVD